MKIVLACPYAWDAPGGVQVHIGQLAGQLKKRGHQTLIVTPARGKVSEPGVVVVGRTIGIPFNRSIAPVCFSLRSRRLVRRSLRDFSPDLVHAHEPVSPSTAMYASLASQVPVVATFHAYAEPVRLYAPWGRSYLVRRMLEKIAVRIAVSEAAASFAQRGLGGSYRIVPNGVQVSLFEGVDPAPDLPLGRRLLFVNRLERRKGFQMAVRAFLQLATEFSDLHLVVAGDGPERTALSELPRALHDRVIMLGNVPHGLLPPYHAGADVFLAPALGRESFGIVLVEAMAARVPVVASDIAGYREVVRSDLEGILVPPGDPSALADAVRRVLLDPALAARLAEAGRARAERYRWDVVIEQIEAVYQEALEKRAVR